MIDLNDFKNTVKDLKLSNKFDVDKLFGNLCIDICNSIDEDNHGFCIFPNEIFVTKDFIKIPELNNYSLFNIPISIHGIPFYVTKLDSKYYFVYYINTCCRIGYEYHLDYINISYSETTKLFSEFINKGIFPISNDFITSD